MDVFDLLDSVVGDFHASLGFGAAGTGAGESPDVEEVVLSVFPGAEERDVVYGDFLTGLDGARGVGGLYQSVWVVEIHCVWSAIMVHVLLGISFPLVISLFGKTHSCLGINNEMFISPELPEK